MEAPSEEELIHNYLLDIKRKLGGVYLEESEEIIQDMVPADNIKNICSSLVELAEFLSEKLDSKKISDSEQLLRMQEEVQQSKEETEYFKNLLRQYEELYHTGLEKQNNIYDKLFKVEEQLANQINLNQINSQKHNFKDIEQQNKAICQNLQLIVESLHQELDQQRKQLKLVQQELKKVKQQNTEANMALEVSHAFGLEQQKEILQLSFEKSNLSLKIIRLQEEIEPLLNEVQNSLSSPTRIEVKVNYESNLQQQFSQLSQKQQCDQQKMSQNMSYERSTSVINLKKEINFDTSRNNEAVSWCLKSSLRQSLIISSDEGLDSPRNSSKSQSRNTVKHQNTQRQIQQPTEVEAFVDLGSMSVITEGETNSYFDFFLLTCQCAKLNNSKNYRVYGVQTRHLYQVFLRTKIPFNQWYALVRDYLLENIKVSR